MAEKSNNSHHDKNVELKVMHTALVAELEMSEATGNTIQARRLSRKLERVATEVVKSNKGLVVRTASRYFPKGSFTGNAEDYISAARMGLWEAFKSWDVKQASFAHWAVRHMEGLVRREVRTMEMSEISYGDFSARPKVRASQSRLRLSLEREPTFAEIAEDAYLSETLVTRVLTPRPASLDASVRAEGRMSVGARLADVRAEQRLGELSITVESLGQAKLTPTELWVHVRNNGLDGAPAQPLAHIGARIGMGRQSVQRAAARARTKVGVK